MLKITDNKKSLSAVAQQREFIGRQSKDQVKRKSQNDPDNKTTDDGT